MHRLFLIITPLSVQENPILIYFNNLFMKMQVKNIA